MNLQWLYYFNTIAELEHYTRAGMEFVAAYDAFTREAPGETSERIYIIVREHGK